MNIKGLIRSVWFPGTWYLTFSVFIFVFGNLEIFWAGWASAFLSVVFLLDSRARLLTYLYFRENPPKISRIPALIVILRGSFCSRQVAIALFPHDAPKMYDLLGYKWYHVIPDSFFRGQILSKNFWRSVIFPTQTTKYPYE